MPVHAISIDFWNTLVVASANGRERQARRLDRLSTVCESMDRPRSRDRILAAYRLAQDRFTGTWLGERRTPPADRFVHWIWESLDVPVEGEEHDRTVDCFRNVLLEHPPELAPGAADTLRLLVPRFPIVIISDTMLSPGSTIRLLLDRLGLLDHFAGFVFSDESGFAKPDPRAFEAAALAADTTTRHLMHVGDLRPTDVAGALATGATAVLFTGIHLDQSEGPEPDMELHAWADLPPLV
jgi:putative hydrolase of the HAD superfamily